jgi:hypothetical protein
MNHYGSQCVKFHSEDRETGDANLTASISIGPPFNNALYTPPKALLRNRAPGSLSHTICKQHGDVLVLSKGNL